ncbi:MAG: XRE family transcriptional regulator, partial [Chloroflexi bacterium]|nr:XRE family transcriptional regulator [Chloroflexota bacterium]
MRAPERTFGQQLRRLRVERGLTQQTLAERAGLATRAVAALEGGARRRPYPHTVAVLAEALGLVAHERASFTELAGRVAPPAAPAVAVAWLPVWPTALVGREDEVRAICGLLHPEGSAVRLLSLVGPGGVGKTRLAVAAAAALVPHYPDGVVFVDLAPVREPRFVAATIARALKLREAGAREQLPAYLHARQLLLVLDNFEHLLGAGPLLAKLLAECPAVALLVTSRAALHLRGEQRFPVAPLATPVDGSASLEAIGGAPAVRLFVERARAADPAFVLEATNAQAVAGVCRRLEGLPLTLELAAARASLLSPEALLRRLERRLPVLTGGAADLPERQQTLRSTLVWSFDLLEPAAQVLFRRLAVFVGGWTLEAAEAICADATLAAGDVLNRLQELVDSSLVRRLETGTREPRYGQLETVREYAGEELVTSGELERIRAAHAVFYTRLAEPAAAAQTSAPWVGGQAPALTDAALDRLEAELDNLQAALDWWATTGRPAEGLHLAVGLSPLWSRRGHYAAGRRWLEALLELADQPAPAGALSPTPA